MNDRKAKRGGMGLVSTLTLVFVVLKLLKVIDWNWFWVFAPVWISALLVGIAFLIVLLAGKIKKGKW